MAKALVPAAAGTGIAHPAWGRDTARADGPRAATRGRRLKALAWELLCQPAQAMRPSSTGETRLACQGTTRTVKPTRPAWLSGSSAT